MTTFSFVKDVNTSKNVNEIGTHYKSGEDVIIFKSGKQEWSYEVTTTSKHLTNKFLRNALKAYLTARILDSGKAPKQFKVA